MLKTFVYKKVHINTHKPFDHLNIPENYIKELLSSNINNSFQLVDS